MVSTNWIKHTKELNSIENVLNKKLHVGTVGMYELIGCVKASVR